MLILPEVVEYLARVDCDSMLAPEDLPGQHARVMRVAPSSTPTSSKQEPKAQSPPSLAPPLPTSEQKVDKFSDDYASSSDEDEPISRQQEKEDDGWGVVQTKKKSTPILLSYTIKSISHERTLTGN